MKPKYPAYLIKSLALPALITLSFLPAAMAQQPSTSSWTGAAATNDWNTADNWDPVGVPASEDFAEIQASNVSTSDHAVTDLAQLLVDDSFFALNHNLGIVSVEGLVDPEDPEAGYTQHGGLYVRENGSINLNNGGTLSINGGTAWVGHAASMGTLNVFSGGTLNTSNVELRIGNGGTGILNLEAGGKIIAGSEINIGREGDTEGTFNQTGGTLTHTSGDLKIAAFGANGTYNLSNGTAQFHQLRLNFAGAGNGVINQTGGYASLTGEPAIGWGNTGNGTYNMSGGILETDSRLRIGVGGHLRQNLFNQTDGHATINGRIDLGEGATDLAPGEPGAPEFINKYSISGGSLTVTDAILIGAFSDATGTFEMSGDAEVDATRIQLGAGDATFVNTLNLLGGTLRLQRIHAGDDVTVPQVVNLDGVTLIAKQGEGNFLAGGLMSVNLGENGATVNTNGFAVGIAKPIEGPGHLIKTGAGTLTFRDVDNTYEGGTTISGGMIQLTSENQLGAPNTIHFTGSLGGAIKNDNSELVFSADRPMIIDSGAKAFFVAGWGQPIIIHGKITGGGDVVAPNEGGAVTLANAGNDYTGDTIIGAIPYRYGAAGAARIRLGANNGLGNTRSLIFDGGYNDSYNEVTSFFDLAGFNTSVPLITVDSGVAVIENSTETNSILTIGTGNFSTHFPGEIRDNVSIVKTGNGNLDLAGSNSYSGFTKVEDGTLIVNGSSIHDEAELIIQGGKVNVSSDEVVGSLIINGTPMSAGVYGSSSSSAPAENQLDDHFTGYGMLTVQFDAELDTPEGFDAWIAGDFANGNIPANQQGPNDDPDGDGISNLIEYAVADLDPTAGNGSVGTWSDNTYTVNKRQPLADDLSYVIEQSASLESDSWTEVTPDVNDDNVISYTLPTDEETPRNFIRLKVVQP